MPRQATGVVLIIFGALFAAGVMPATPLILGILVMVVGAALLV